MFGFRQDQRPDLVLATKKFGWSRPVTGWTASRRDGPNELSNFSKDLSLSSGRMAGRWAARSRSLAAVDSARVFSDRGQEANRCVPEEAFLAGLLHDIGRTVMDQVLPTEYADVLELVETGGSASWLSAEQRVCGFDRTHLGTNSRNEFLIFLDMNKRCVGPFTMFIESTR